jgi:hypothetical protein
MVLDCWSNVQGTIPSCITFGFLVMLICWYQRRLAIESRFKTPLDIPISSWLNMKIKGGLNISMSLEKSFCKSWKSCSLWFESKTQVIGAQFLHVCCCLLVVIIIVYLLLNLFAYLLLEQLFACCYIFLLVVALLVIIGAQFLLASKLHAHFTSSPMELITINEAKCLQLANLS